LAACDNTTTEAYSVICNNTKYELFWLDEGSPNLPASTVRFWAGDVHFKILYTNLISRSGRVKSTSIKCSTPYVSTNQGWQLDPWVWIPAGFVPTGYGYEYKNSPVGPIGSDTRNTSGRVWIKYFTHGYPVDTQNINIPL
jgi:hypothetical protein